MKNEKTTEKELLYMAQYDDDAFACLYERYHRLVYYVAYQMCHNDADAQDVVQETFLEVKRCLPNLKNPKYFRLWLYRIVNSKCKKIFRKNKYAYTDIEQDHILNLFLEQNEQFLPDAQSKYQSDQKLMYSFINDLPYDQKHAILLYYAEQLTTLEIARLLQIPEGTVKSRLSVARASLKKRIESYEHREGIKLNFHEGAGSIALLSTILADQKKDILFPFKQAYQSHSQLFQSVAMAIKTTVIAGCFGVMVLSGISMVNDTRSAMAEAQNPIHEAKSFPVLYFRGTTIQSEKDAYYTLKMNVCMQDIAQLNEEQRLEVLPLYNALKKENGIYYERLRQSGWAEEFERYGK